MGNTLTTRAPVPPAARRLLGSAAALSRFHPEQTDVIEAAKRQAELITLEDHIKRVVESAPPLSPEQRDRLAHLLRSGDLAEARHG